MGQTLKHISIFLLFLAALVLGNEAKPYLERVLPGFKRETVTLFVWSTLVVVAWHLMFHYLGRMADRVVYALSAVIVLGMLMYYRVIDIF